MRSYRAPAVWLVAFAAASCGGDGGTNPPANQTPVADFTVTCNGLDCIFTDGSSDPDGASDLASWSWDFGEPASGAENTSTEQNPTHTYTATEVTGFTVTLTVTDAQNAQSTKTQTITVTPAASCADASDQTIDCTLDISQKSTLVITLTSRDCAFTGNTFDITEPIQQEVFINGCQEPVGTEYHINNDIAFDAGTQLKFQFTQGVGAPDDPPRVPPQIRLEGTYPTWTISIDDGGNSGQPGEPDFNDLVLTAQATQVP